MKDNDIEFHYHLGKTNMVANDLSYKSDGFVAQLMVKEWCY